MKIYRLIRLALFLSSSGFAQKYKHENFTYWTSLKAELEEVKQRPFNEFFIECTAWARIVDQMEFLRRQQAIEACVRRLQ